MRGSPSVRGDEQSQSGDAHTQRSAEQNRARRRSMPTSWRRTQQVEGVCQQEAHFQVERAEGGGAAVLGSGHIPIVERMFDMGKITIE
ncbi:hypothetical protein [Saccharothrix yanglingensis]|uniref:hypothetical protein n=1 Tax=Saccharothrix yanglingensis TaxID=659496 RepID=UPI0027D22F24|nr:hypothetical protein [Saccharothrix yanglingensis]